METIIKQGDMWTIEIAGEFLQILFGDNVYILREETPGVKLNVLNENMASMELLKITKLGVAEGRYGGPSTLCELSFELSDNTIVKAYFAMVTLAQSHANDTMTAFTMPLPWSPV